MSTLTVDSLDNSNLFQYIYNKSVTLLQTVGNLSLLDIHIGSLQPSWLVPVHLCTLLELEF
jgi:hypothetical protein